MNKKHHTFFWIFPFLTGAAFVWVCWLTQFSYTDEGFDNLLDSMINFTSIIIGFYSAFYGILITIKETSFMKNIRGSAIEKKLKYQLFISLLSAFTTLILSMLLQIFQYKETLFSFVIFYIWMFCSGLFMALSLQTIILSLEIVFESDPEKKGFINK
ncbi:hypothetical protein N2F29_07660 [Enterococcus faecium]|uniref:hypothetical protein n=1 Tax=Enterococcus TaxID=1350 RepID=UPI000BA851E1|nr:MULTISPECIES: hypothetical protein [Enterococcus]ASV96574.1 hypothetical protein CJZ72_14040 [Enterococcus durans]EME8210463.1 hypothetical protein [Enterococcus faecium]EMF0325236.1 hypothetical protein [Enterococcus faecium]EMF0581838.1 hypothetical protein [Enterococcus faecium]MCU1962962.1 hypothetical protein [Enterococcus faecium]